MFDFTKQWALPEELEKRIERTEARIEQLKEELAELEKEAEDNLPTADDFVATVRANPAAVWIYCELPSRPFRIYLRDVHGETRFLFSPISEPKTLEFWRPVRYFPEVFDSDPIRMLTPDETKGDAQ